MLRSDVVSLDKRHLWHPYTAADEFALIDPLVVARAQGARLYDADGRSYLDGNAQWWVAGLGHNHPRLIAALKQQADRFCHVSLAGVTHEPAAHLAEELVAIAPAGLSRAFFSDDGSTAIECALKMAVQFWQQSGQSKKQRFVALDGAFHGETLGATSLGGVEIFRRPYAGLLFDCLRARPPYDESSFAETFAALSSLLKTANNQIAALVLEPLVQGANGMRIYAPKFLQAARALCNEHDVLLIVDEVFTGLGRTGKMWACEHAAIAPDILCSAKALGGGLLPFAATLATERIFDAFRGDRSRMFYYGHSFGGNPLGAAVAREMLRVFADEKILDGITERSDRIAHTFSALGNISGTSRPRALGMIGAIDLPSANGYHSSIGWRVFEEAKKRGAYLRPLGDVVYVTPALNIPLSDLGELLQIVRESVISAAG